MESLNFNKSVRNRALKLLKVLFTDYKVIKINKYGNVTFKKKWYSLPIRTSIYRLLIDEIPTKLSKLRGIDYYKQLYVYQTVNRSLSVFYNFEDLIDYFYTEYWCTKHPPIIIETDNQLSEKIIETRAVSLLFKNSNSKKYKEENTISLLELILTMKSIRKLFY
jgi:hypothetical protein